MGGRGLNNLCSTPSRLKMKNGIALMPFYVVLWKIMQKFLSDPW